MAPSARPASSGQIASLSDETKYVRKEEQLTQLVRQVEETNARIQIAILEKKKAIQRMRIERSILYSHLEQQRERAAGKAPQ
ncbi:uncharacterized protein L969DRAFT_69678 [Mixia osmundae IAM 14324]|uniref:INO80 complex subunit F domain-containing protein n=1 Tax=Mixia osmundae (strain CBS 9802 / IAM 14324 / JCM 22182 / KY 12970) TaxID=764103 RepID=G7E2Z7_MIXOS|nr:uncharacterized protein L969DRAFT_69678 [Mixia osmundae IAM 14324]KEI42533.1 hypothetical protein L969DRAFT_69678 [Mixia osmundae IAM 14324]GAA97178.1 hypothetical protein E5Q_03854 [Mixia osmundae IAM 14324]